MLYIKDIYNIAMDKHYKSWIPLNDTRSMKFTIAHIENKSYNKIVTMEELLKIKPYGLFPANIRSFGNGKIEVLNHLDVEYASASNIDREANFIMHELEVIDTQYLTIFSSMEINGVDLACYDVVDLIMKFNKYFPDFGVLTDRDFFLTDKEDKSKCFRIVKDAGFAKAITKYILRNSTDE